MDGKTWEFVEQTFGRKPCSMYGSTEVGVIIVNYPGFEGYEVRAGRARHGRARAGRWRWSATTARCRPDSSARSRSGAAGEWFRVKDRGSVDADGYFFHAGRSDDVIISAGWTMSALEIEQALLAHPDVRRGGGDRRPRRAARPDPQGVRRRRRRDGGLRRATSRSS